jgi:hypothetical protein
MMDSIELQYKLDEARGKFNNNKVSIRTYSASAGCQKDVENLSRIGLSDSEIARALDVPLLRVRKYQAMVERARAEEREFLVTGQLPWLKNEGYLAILQK